MEKDLQVAVILGKEGSGEVSGGRHHRSLSSMEMGHNGLYSLGEGGSLREKQTIGKGVT